MNPAPKIETFDHLLHTLLPKEQDTAESALSVVVDRGVHAQSNDHSFLRDLTRLTNTTPTLHAHAARDELRHQVRENAAGRIQRAARRQMGDDTWEHRRSRLPVLRVPGVQDIVLSRRFNPQAGALLGGPPGSAAANATVRRLRGMMEEHGVRQLTGGARHAYAPLIDRGR